MTIFEELYSYSWILSLLSKNLNFSKIFLGEYAGIGKEILIISICLFLEESAFNDIISFLTLGVNLFIILFLKELL